MRYVKNRRRPAHTFAIMSDHCVHCGWTRHYIVENRAKRCPVAEQRRQREARS